MQVGPPTSLTDLASNAAPRTDLARQSAGFARVLDLARAEAPEKPAATKPIRLKSSDAFLPLRSSRAFLSLDAADRTGPEGFLKLDRGASTTDPRFIPLSAQTPTPKPADEDVEDRARKAAEDLVSVVLVEPILKRLRESNQAAPPFAPTNGQKQFQSMLDAKLAHRVTSAAHFPLVDRLARDLRSQMRTEAQITHAARQ